MATSTDHIVGEGRRVFEMVQDLDLEGVVAKRLSDPYAPDTTCWWKILNRSYTQKVRRADLFKARR